MSVAIGLIADRAASPDIGMMRAVFGTAAGSIIIIKKLRLRALTVGYWNDKNKIQK